MPWTAPRVVRDDTRIGGATGVLILPLTSRLKDQRTALSPARTAELEGFLMSPRQVRADRLPISYARRHAPPISTVKCIAVLALVASLQVRRPGIASRRA
jgi:hypothetical protein